MEIFKIYENKIEAASFEYFVANQGEKFLLLASCLEISEHNNILKIKRRNISDIMAKEPPKLEVYDNYYFGIVKVLSDIDRYSDSKDLSFFLKESWLIIVSERSLPVIEGIKADLLGSEQRAHLSEDKILHMFFDRITSGDFSAVDSIEQQITELEAAVIEGQKGEFIKQIIDYRKKLLFLKSYYEHLLDISQSIEENENGIIDDSAIVLFRILTNRVERLNRNVLTLRDYVTQVREAYQAQVDISLNNIMKLFTVITAIFMPLTLIAGWYGMNFKYMPEISWIYGYPFAFVLSAAVVVFCIYWFKKTKFL